MQFKELTEHFTGKKVLVTGGSGFKGSWLSLVLSMAGAQVFGFSKHYEETIQNLLPQETRILGDIANFSEVKGVIEKIKPDYIFNLAAQPLTITAYETPRETFEVNVMGTINVLEAVRQCNTACKLIMITSDKCYQNNEWIWGYRENDVLAGKDPYSASKSAAEIAIHSYSQSYFKNTDHIQIASCRAGNVIGGGDWSSHRIVPDCFKAWSQKKPVEVRNPGAVRPWNYVLDVVYGYILVAINLNKTTVNGQAFNFGPLAGSEVAVNELVDLLWQNWPDKTFNPILISTDKMAYFEHTYLKLNCDKARGLLGWQPKLTIKQVAQSTSKWYFNHANGDNMASFAAQQIRDYFEA